MNRTNQILAVILVVQLIVAGVVYLRPDDRSEDSAARGGAFLADFNPDDVTGIRIEDSDGLSIEVKQNAAGEWVLPSADDYPVRAAAASDLLGKLDALQANRLIAQNASSHTRLQVSDSDFSRKISLTLKGDKQRLVYVGSTVGSNAVHVRLDGSDEVYLVTDFAPFDANPALTTWVDTLYFSAVRDRIESVTLENLEEAIKFVKQEDDTWTVNGLASNERVNDSSVSSLLSSVTSIRLVQPVGREVDASYGLDAPLATITVVVAPEPVDETATATPSDGDTPPVTDSFNLPSTEAPEVYTLTIGAATENGYYLKSSASDYVVLISTTTGDNFVPKLRGDYVTALAVQILG